MDSINLWLCLLLIMLEQTKLLNELILSRSDSFSELHAGIEHILKILKSNDQWYLAFTYILKRHCLGNHNSICDCLVTGAGPDQSLNLISC